MTEQANERASKQKN